MAPKNQATLIDDAMIDLRIVEINSGQKAAIRLAVAQMIGGLLYLEIAAGKERAARTACAMIDAAGIMTMVPMKERAARTACAMIEAAGIITPTLDEPTEGRDEHRL